METLEIVIGLIFIYLLLSLLGTTVQELWSSAISLRGKTLLKAVAKLLEVDTAEGMDKASKSKMMQQFRQRIKNSKVYQKYSGRFMWIEQLPSYLSAEQVTALISELMDEESGEQEGAPRARGMKAESAEPPMLTNMVQKDLAKNLSLIHQGGQAQSTVRARGILMEPEKTEEELSKVESIVDKAKLAFKKQYDEIMDRASGWYKRSVQAYLLVFGFLIAFCFDADTFKVWHNLTYNPNSRQELLQLAQGFVDQERINIYTINPDSLPADSLERVSQLRGLIDTLLYNEIQKVPSPLGLGWGTSIPQQIHDGNWDDGPLVLFYLKKFFGWLVTALAISLGAPFWFDLLQKIIQIRNAGIRPQDAERAAAKLKKV